MDPSSEREVFPGDFAAKDTSLTAQAAGGEQISLESVVLSNITLRDDAGQVIQLPKGAKVPVRMKIPENLQARYRQEYKTGTRIIPWWSYDEQEGLWVREGDATLIDVDGVLYAEGTATHFSWWNVDWPISTHAKLCGKVIDGDGNPLKGVSVVAEGVDYQGNSSDSTNQDGEYEIQVKRLSQVKLHASYGEIVSPSRLINVEDTSVTACQDQDDLVLAVVHVGGKVVDADGNPLSGVQVRADNGNAVYTDANGNFSIKSVADSTLKLVASYVVNGIRNSVDQQVVVGETDTANTDIVLDINPAEISGKVMLEQEGGQAPMKGVTITASNGQSAVTDENGFYSIYAANIPGDEISIDYSAYLPSGIHATRSQSVKLDGSLDVPAPDAVFKEAVANLTGRVVDQRNEPLSGIEVTSNTGKTAITDPEGTFEVRVPVNQEVSVTASYRDPQADLQVSTTSPTYFISPDGGGYPVPDLRLDTRTAFVAGTVRSAQGERKPLSGVKVVTEYGAMTTTDENGNYLIKVPADATVQVSFSYELLDEAGKRERWGAMVSNQAKTGALGTQTSLDVDLALESNPPQITGASVNPATVAPGGEATFTVSASDPDGDTLTYSWVDDNGNEVGTGQTYPWTAPETTGVYELKVIAKDGTSPAVSCVVQVMVKQNSSPTILNMWVSPEVVRPGDTVKATVNAFDGDGDAITYQWNQADMALSESGDSTYSLSIPADLAEGTYPLKVTVTDSQGATTSQSADFTVQKNRSPVISAIVATPSPAQVGDNVAMTVTASDPDGDFLNFSWIDEDGSSLGTGRSISWQAPAVDQEKVFKFTASASDGELTSSQNVYVKVQPLAQSGGEEPPPVSGGTVSGFLSDQLGNAIPNALVELYSADRSVDIVTTSSDAGYYEFTGLASGDYYVVVSRDGFTMSSALVTVSAE